MNIRIALQECAESFAEARGGSRESANKAVKKFCDELSKLLPDGDRAGILLKSGLGMGSFADVPWVAILHERFGGTASNGYFVVFLFAKDSKRVYLTMGVGAGSAVSGNWRSADRVSAEARAMQLRSQCRNLADLGFRLANDLDLSTTAWRARSYVAGTAAYKVYDTDKLPDASEIEVDFLQAYECFSRLIEQGFSLDEPIDSGRTREFQDTPISRALLAKPFLILTGPSGTGKTRGAIQLAESLCDADCRVVVAVGADWTDNRHVLGFLNPLQTADGTPDGVPIYETTEILNLLLHANAEGNREKPHVLILDEMNLSHVERYFADFLSAMELEDKEKALKLHSAGCARTRGGVDVAGSIDFPENLFVIGTVNIDETTYMFSPKVLDRANVIEVHADPAVLGNFLRGIGGEAGAELRDYGVSFLEAALAIRTENEHHDVPLVTSGVSGFAADRLVELFEIMKRGRGEFGFRTGREVLAYLRAAYFLTPEAQRTAWSAADGEWIKALDAQILQKILPKLHGSRTRLAPLLGALAQYCATGSKASAMEHFPERGSSAKRGLSDARNIPNPKFEESYRKLERMIEVLVEEQFVSFIC
jgi:5-methylcytosine-specific restriction protein B